MTNFIKSEITLNKEQFKVFNYRNQFGVFDYVDDELLNSDNWTSTYRYQTNPAFIFSYLLEKFKKEKYDLLDEEYTNILFNSFDLITVNKNNQIIGHFDYYDFTIIATKDNAFRCAKKIYWTFSPLKFFESDIYYPIVLVPSSIKKPFKFPDDTEILKKEPNILVPKKPFQPKEPIKPIREKIVYEEQNKYQSRFLLILFFIVLIGLIVITIMDIVYSNGLLLGFFFVIFFGIVYLFATIAKFLSNPDIPKKVKIPDEEFALCIEKYNKEEQIYLKNLEKYNNELESYKTANEKYLDAIYNCGEQIIIEEYKNRLCPNENPFRAKSFQRKGNSEVAFLEKLLAYFPNGNIKVNLSLGDFEPPYFPDFVYICEKTNLHIDIEIDEKYAFLTKEPIHFIDGSDDVRNQFFLGSNWVVIRFCEEQILKYPTECCKFIKDVVQYIINPFTEKSIQFDFPRIKRWSYEEAYIDGHKDNRKNSDNPSITDIALGLGL